MNKGFFDGQTVTTTVEIKHKGRVIVNKDERGIVRHVSMNGGVIHVEFKNVGRIACLEAEIAHA